MDTVLHVLMLLLYPYQFQSNTLGYTCQNNHIITTQTEHKCVLESCRNLNKNGFDINYLNPIIFFRPVEYSLNSPNNVFN